MWLVCYDVVLVLLCLSVCLDSFENKRQKVKLTTQRSGPWRDLLATSSSVSTWSSFARTCQWFCLRPPGWRFQPQGSECKIDQNRIVKFELGTLKSDFSVAHWPMNLWCAMVVTFTYTCIHPAQSSVTSVTVLNLFWSLRLRLIFGLKTFKYDLDWQLEGLKWNQ